MKIAIGTDHRGRDIKLEIINRLNAEYEFIDCSKVNTDDDDYPDFAYAVCKEVKENNAEYGILICGTGNGMAITANKIKGIRCAIVHDLDEARLVRVDNDANVMAFSSKTQIDTMCEAIRVFTTTLKEDGRHARRREKIIKIENGEYDKL